MSYGRMRRLFRTLGLRDDAHKGACRTWHVGRGERSSQRRDGFRSAVELLVQRRHTVRMIRSDLAARVAKLNPRQRQRDCEAAVNVILGCIADALIAGGRAELRGFGTFAVKRRRAQLGRNPRTGAAVYVSAKASVRFKPSKGMQTRLNLEPEPRALVAE